MFILQVSKGSHRYDGKLYRAGGMFATAESLHTAFPDKFNLVAEKEPVELEAYQQAPNPNEKEDCKQRTVSRGGLLVIAYWTVGTPYAHEAYVLSKTLDAQDMAYDMRGVPNLGSWQKNTQYKATFVKGMMQEYPDRRLLYLDVDCLVLKPPAEVLDMKGDVDFAVNITPRNKALHSGTLYFGATDGAKKLVQKWVEECVRFPEYLPGRVEAWDQRVLHRVVQRSPWLRWEVLSLPYCYVVGLSQREDPSAVPILLHTRGALRFKRMINNQKGYES